MIAVVLLVGCGPGSVDDVVAYWRVVVVLHGVQWLNGVG